MTVPPLWTPRPDAISTTRLGAFMRFVQQRRGLSFGGDSSSGGSSSGGSSSGGSFSDDYAALWQWSVGQLEDFWADIWDFFQIIAATPATTVLEQRRMPGPVWFPGARLNYAENVLRLPGIADDEPVVLAYSQSREPTTLTAAHLREQVRRVRAGLQRLGVGRGDRVAAYLPNVPETYLLLLATASLGATFSSCAPEFGTRSVVDRWRQIEPSVLVAVDGYRYGGKVIDRAPEVAQIRAELPSLRHVVTLPYVNPDRGDKAPGGLTWAELAAPTPQPLAFEPVPFDHPLYVLYSSGTTGLPKPIVHGHGGILLEHLKALALHHDLGSGDRFFWFSTTGWMMWNFLVSAPAVGSAIVMFDGDPGWPDLGALWRLAAEAGMTYFGTSAPYLMACRKAGLVPREIADLSRLRGLGSTGAPLPAEGFAWVYEAVSDTLQLQSLSGGTDVCTGFVGSAPLLPVYPGEIACRCLGARVEAYDATGRSVVGQLGELVITAPMPSMPVGFWNDPTGERYRSAYFDVYPGVWRHGDWITITERGSCVITGRSDATLNRGGVRLGTSEFYAVVEGLDQVSDSLVVHLDETDQLLLFVVLAPGATLDDPLRATIRSQLRTALSPRHVPDEIYQVPAVPRTLSGKKLEVPVKRILQGVPAPRAAATGALVNPESLAAFESLAHPAEPV